jgi:monoamine oxidase
MVLNGRRTAYRWMPFLSAGGLWSLGGSLLEIERLRSRVGSQVWPVSKQGAELDRQTAGAFVDACGSPDARALLTVMLRALVCVEPHELSAYHALSLTDSNGGLLNQTQVRGGTLETRFIGGAQRLSEEMAAQIKGSVRLETPVTVLEQDDAGVRVVAGRGTVRARHCIVSAPPSLAARMLSDMPGAEHHRRLREAMVGGRVIKFVVAYPQAFWRSEGYSGAFSSDRGPVNMAFDYCAGEAAALVGFIVGDAASEWSPRSPANRQRAIVSALVEQFGAQAGEPTGYAERDWTTEEWSTGCYSAFCPPGVLTERGWAMREPLGRIHFAGTETATEFAGYMEGALESGERAATEVLAR